MKKMINREFELVKLDSLQEQAFWEDLSTYKEVEDLVSGEVENLWYEVENIDDDFIRSIMIDVLEEIEINDKVEVLCDLLEIND